MNKNTIYIRRDGNEGWRLCTSEGDNIFKLRDVLINCDKPEKVIREWVKAWWKWDVNVEVLSDD